MITAFTSRLRDIFGQGYTPVTRKRTLDEEDDEILAVGGGEPARKRSRPLTETEEPSYHSYSSGGDTISRGIKKISNSVWSWMSSFITPSVPYDDHINLGISSNDLQYLGTVHRTRMKDAPTKRPAITRRSVDVSQMKRDHPSLASIDANFRFSPSITSTASKASKLPSAKSLLSERYQPKSSSLIRNVYSHKKSSLVGQPSVKRLGIYEKYPILNPKSILKSCSRLSNKGRYCTQEAFRHEDKARYKQLLQQYSDGPLDSSFSASKVPSIITLSSNSRSASPQSIISRSHLDAKWTKDKVQQIEATVPKSPLIMSKSGDTTSSQSLYEKYSGRMRTGIKKTSPLTNGTATANASKESDDDCLIVAEEIKTTAKRSSLDRTLLENPIFDEKWHRDLNERFNLRAKLKAENAKKTVERYKICEEVRKQAHTSLEDRIAQRIKHLHLSYPSKIEEILDEKEEEEEEELPELTPNMLAVIEDALDNRAPGQVLVDKFNIQITRRDIATLSGLNWLNDEVVNFYMNLLIERGKNSNYLNVYAFNTFFYPKLMKMGYSSVRRWTKKIDIFSHDLILVPVHLGMHWCLATIDFRTKHIRYYDSMLGDNDRCLEALVKYLESEHQDKKQSNYDTSGWTLDNVKNIPQQMNGSDCGMFACKFSEYLSRDAKITFDQQHMPYFRQRMIYEIVSGKLL